LCVVRVGRDETKQRSPKRENVMPKQRKNLTELLKLACKLPEEQQLELISRLSSRLLSQKVVKAKPKTWMEMAGLGKEIWKNVDAQEYVRQERANWGD
jgi:hypothetical protein